MTFNFFCDIPDSFMHEYLPSFIDKLKQRKEKEFLKIVESTFNDLSNSKNRNLSNSPIIEGIYKLTLQVFNKNGTSAKGKLLIISDLEQNTN